MVRDLRLLTDSHVLPPARLRLLHCEGYRAQDVLSHKGVTWNKYEGMSVTLQPTVGNLTVSAINGGGFQTTPGLTDWGNTFDSDYYPAGATTFPMQGATYRSISGVVATRHGGEIMPVRNKDFVP